MQLFDTLPSGLSAGATLEIVELKGREERTLTVPVTGDARGVRRLGDVALRFTTPLGLLARISPPVGAARRSPSSRRSPTCAGSGCSRCRIASVKRGCARSSCAVKETAFAGLRDYVPGDDPRMLDWKATARHGRLISREQTIERSQTVISLVDCGCAMTQLAGHYSRFEHVLSAALVLSDVAVDERRPGRPARLRRPDSCVQCPPGGGDRALRASTPLAGRTRGDAGPSPTTSPRSVFWRRRSDVGRSSSFSPTSSAPCWQRTYRVRRPLGAAASAFFVVAIQNEALLAAVGSRARRGATALHRSAGGPGVGARAGRSLGPDAERWPRRARRGAGANG